MLLLIGMRSMCAESAITSQYSLAIVLILQFPFLFFDIVAAAIHYAFRLPCNLQEIFSSIIMLMRWRIYEDTLACVIYF